MIHNFLVLNNLPSVKFLPSLLWLLFSSSAVLTYLSFIYTDEHAKLNILHETDDGVVLPQPTMTLLRKVGSTKSN